MGKTTAIEAVVKIFIMQLLVFFAIVGLAYAVKRVEHPTELPIPPWANETKYGRYQDAWKSLNQNSTTRYWLVSATFNDDGASWGSDFQCLSVQETNLSETNKSVVSVFKFLNASNPTQVHTVEEQVEAVFMYNYTQKPNGIQYTLKNGTKLNDTVIFSNKNCDILSVPYMNNGNGCELWVRDEHVDKVPTCCLFIYEFFCTKNVTTYNIYKNNCKNLTILN
uniref:Uncharacterized protein n=1 Tax=Amblyomma americanum TaxID=6943 RepID=A0A0C9S5D0_AMBAM